MRRLVMIGAGSAALLGLAAPATAGEPVAEPAPASRGAETGSADEWVTAEGLDGAPSGQGGRVLVMTLSKPQPAPEPRPASDPGELRKRASAKRPPGMSN